MAEAAAGFLEQLKSCIVWSWTYLWTVWFFIVLFLVYILRVPLRINDNLSTGQARARPPLPPPRKVSASRSLGVAAGGGARARGRAASGGGPSPAALAGPRCLGAGGARPPHARECPGGPWLVPAEPRELLSFTRGSSVRTAATGVLLPAARRRPTRGPGCGRTLLGSRVEPWPAGCRCEVDREGMSVGPSRSRDDVSGHPTECPGDTRTRGDLGFLTSPVAVFMFSAELALKCDGLNKCACGA